MNIRNVALAVAAWALLSGTAGLADTWSEYYYSYHSLFQWDSDFLEMRVDVFNVCCHVDMEASLSDQQEYNIDEMEWDQEPYIDNYVFHSEWLDLNAEPGHSVRVEVQNQGTECDFSSCRDWNDSVYDVYYMEPLGAPEAYYMDPAEGTPGAYGSFLIEGSDLWGAYEVVSSCDGLTFSNIDVDGDGETVSGLYFLKENQQPGACTVVVLTPWRETDADDLSFVVNAP